MERLFKQIKIAPDLKPKFDLRKKIRNKIIIIKFQSPFLVIFFSLIISLLFLSINSYLKIIESEAILVINVFISDFRFSFDYISNFAPGFQEVLPVKILVVWLVNFSLVMYLTKIFHYYRHELFNYK